MKKNNIARLNMYDSMILLFDANQTLIARIPAFRSGTERFRQTVTDLKVAAEEEKVQSGGVTEAKKLQKAAVAADVAALAGAAFSYANDHGRPELAGEMKYSERDLQRLKDQDFILTCRRVVKGVRAELASLADYAVTAAMLDDADADISAYEKGAPAPRKVIVHRSDASDRVEELDAQAGAILRLTLDKLLKQYAKTDPAFVNQYKKTRSIVDAQTSGTSLVVDVSGPDAQPLAAAEVRIEGTGVKGLTDAHGKCILKDLEPGTKKITIAHRDYAQKTLEDVQLKPGKSNKLKAAL